VGYYRKAQGIFTHGQNAIPLGIGLVPDDKRRALQEKLVYDVLVTRTGHEMVGIASSRWIFDVLTDAAIEGVPGAAEATYAMALQTTYPSYCFWISLGWTGLGEYWETSSRTRDHEMYGSIGQWLYQDLAGIQSTAPGFKQIRIRPLVVADDRLTSVSASYDSVNGAIASAWERTGAQLHLNVTIPANTTAEIGCPRWAAAIVR
jgi:alpha-L-rhamnosidase